MPGPAGCVVVLCPPAGCVVAADAPPVVLPGVGGPGSVVVLDGAPVVSPGDGRSTEGLTAGTTGVGASDKSAAAVTPPPARTRHAAPATRATRRR
ncbi:hypothetical protein [Streptomyces venezuelae]|uniref:hypothetical protein n=1 Tax=Streptomyces venezuelae TaxID=54571 RepID=UPI00168CB691|nr:hypothetical protein [Streptomyces venezuelae]